MIHLTDNDFEKEVLQSDKPVLVDFWAIGCSPCRYLEPILNEVEVKMPNIKFCKIEGSENMEPFVAYGVSTVPTMVLFNGGQQLSRISGLWPEDKIIDFIKTKIAQPT